MRLFLIIFAVLALAAFVGCAPPPPVLPTGPAPSPPRIDLVPQPPPPVFPSETPAPPREVPDEKPPLKTPALPGDSLELLLNRLDAAATGAEKVPLIQALGDTGRKEAVSPLIQLLTDQNPAVRTASSAALTALAAADFGDAPDKWIPWWAAHQNESREQWLADALRTRAETLRKEQSARLLVTKRLVELQSRNLQALAATERAAQILKLLDDPLSDLRRLAAAEGRRLYQETRQGNPALADKLVVLLQDDSETVRAEAALALAASGDPRAADVLRQRLPADSHPAVQAALISALGELRDARAVDPLVVFLASTDDDLAIRAAGALGAIGERGTPTADAVAPAVAPLGRLLTRDGSAPAVAEVHEAAARALSKIARKETLPLLLNCLNDPAPAVRFFAAQGLGNIGRFTPEAIVALEKRLADTDKGVRAAAADALGRIGCIMVRYVIADRLAPGNETDADVRAALWTALAAIEKRTAGSDEIEKLADTFLATEASGAAQLYEIALAKLRLDDNGEFAARLRAKLADAYDRAGQPAKAAALRQRFKELENLKAASSGQSAVPASLP
jgi:HEAT repeat protein